MAGSIGRTLFLALNDLAALLLPLVIVIAVTMFTGKKLPGRPEKDDMMPHGVSRTSVAHNSQPSTVTPMHRARRKCGNGWSIQASRSDTVLQQRQARC